MTTLPAAIFLISAAVLGLELVLIRALSIGHYHHFSYLIISTALLGFGTAGTFISLCSEFLKKHHETILWVFALALAAAAPAVFWASQKVPFDELQLIWDRRQLLYLAALYLLYFVPFFCGGTFIGLSFTVSARKAHQVYFYNMTGSGLGAVAAVLGMYGSPPENLLLAVAAIALLAALLLALRYSRRRFAVTIIAGAALLLAFGPRAPLALKISISQHKSLVQYTAFAKAEHLATRYSPLARLDVVRGPAIRHFPGLSVAYEGPVPRQTLIISDADGISAINHFDDLTELACYDYMTSALPYHLLDNPRVCIIGAGAGCDVAQALASGAAKVTAVEMNPQIIKLARDRFAESSANLYKRPDVRPVLAEGRSFLQTTPNRFDIINISLLDSFTASAAGVYTLHESHLYTVQALQQALDRLSPTGLLSITRLLKTPPPRDSLKMLATVAAALRRAGLANPADNIIMIRGLSTVTIIASPAALSHSQIASTRRFCRRRCFDLVHIPGITLDEVNQFNVLDEAIYYTAAQKILSPDAESFFRDYVYNIRPATDDRPYFFDFFRFKAIPHLMQAIPLQWLQFSELGYLILIAALIQAVVAAALFILLPLFLARPIRKLPSGKLAALVYFLLLGLAYMFLEMGFIQKMTLLIGSPVFGVAATLLGFLFFSGCGALASQRLATTAIRRIWLAALAIIIIGALEITVLAFSFDWLVGFGQLARFCWALALVAPLAFFMGIPFPTALAELGASRSVLVPWAWAINGFASVTAAVLGTILAISLGFTTLALLALAAYLLAALIANKLLPGLISSSTMHI